MWWNGVQKVAYQTVQLHVGDQMRSGLTEHRSAQDSRQAEHRFAATGVTAGSAVLADQFTLHAEDRCLQGNKAEILANDPL